MPHPRTIGQQRELACATRVLALLVYPEFRRGARRNRVRALLGARLNVVPSGTSGFGDTIPARVMIPFLPERNRRAVAMAALVLLAAESATEFSLWAAPTSRAEHPVTQQSPGTESPLPVFELHSGFWVNLHHFLYLQARLMNGNSSSMDSGRGAAPPDEPLASLTDFPAEEVKAWEAAVSFYAKDLARRDLLLNSEMETINNRLSEMETCTEVLGKSSAACKFGLQADLADALDRAAPVYRAHWWPEQDRANREWIAHVAPMVQQMGVELSVQLADVYQRPWPAGRLRVDVVWYGGPYGAYTSLVPTHLTLSSHDVRNQGIYGFEVLFHEGSHALAGAVNEAIAREFRQRDKPIPRDLWHALLFYTTGELVRRDLAFGTMTLAALQGTDPSNYQPYAARFGLYSGSWDRFRGMLDLYWRPYLDGKVSFETAVARLAAVP
jgi:hypothetical protein